MLTFYTSLLDAGEYGAGYYAYQYSLVSCLDALYSSFLKDPFSDVVGGKWRRMVLEPGGTQDSEALLEAFLGRKVSEEAYYWNLNITV
jgi:Zn-dependent oligopeptidase